jgi:hypothetical protein
MPTSNFRVRIVRGDQEFEAEGDKKFVLEMLDRFEGAAPPKSTTTPGRRTTRGEKTDNSKALSAREFIQRLGLKKHTDFGLAFGYYLEKNMGQAEFTPADINNCYYEAKMEPSNTSQVIIQNTKSGRMMQARQAKGAKSGRKTYVLTKTGEDFISEKLAAAQS